MSKAAIGSHIHSLTAKEKCVFFLGPLYAVFCACLMVVLFQVSWRFRRGQEEVPRQHLFAIAGDEQRLSRVR